MPEFLRENVRFKSDPSVFAHQFKKLEERFGDFLSLLTDRNKSRKEEIEQILKS